MRRFAIGWLAGIAPALRVGALAMIGLGVGLGSCAHEVGKDDPSGSSRRDGGVSEGGMSSNGFGNADASTLKKLDAGKLYPRDAEVTADAFFVNDPAPPMCGVDGQMVAAQTPGGTPDCPSDKNREGCPCPKDGMSASCWPGKRLNRNHGICKDGTTTCRASVEFGLRWGPCEGEVLPKPEAATGADACRCFSAGVWTIDNLGPCIAPDDPGGAYLYSGKLRADGTLDCDERVPNPPPAGSWTASTINIDCAGQYKLCYTIKAGSLKQPKPDDCVLLKTCVDVWYAQAGQDQKPPDLPIWRSTDSACAAKFAATYGYGEMSVIGKSGECDVVDDGKGNPYVFYSIDYCPPSCQMTPDLPSCKGCQGGGSGMFGQP